MERMNEVRSASSNGLTGWLEVETDLILGGAIHGPRGDEVINMFAVVMSNRISYKKYREVVLVHPTVSELMPYVLDGLKPVN